MKNRKLFAFVEQQHDSRFGKILVFTGARQTGKTTLARALFPKYAYISVDDPVMRGQYSQLTAAQWKELYPKAIVDEVQKEPSLIESIKSVYDQYPEPKYILLGSSQLLLLEKVKETLAGRCGILELFPLTLPELRTRGWDEKVEDSHFQRILRMATATTSGIPESSDSPEFSRNVLDMIAQMPPSFLLDQKMALKQRAWDHLKRFGGYPAVSDSDLSHEERDGWLRNYVRTYLERDIRDLASFRDLEPFVKMQRYLATHTATLINASSMASQTGITSKTVQRYLRYFEMSYQAVILPAWSRNATKRLMKTPKIHYLDQGVLQAVLQKYGGVTGNEFESIVVGELYKQSKNIQAACTFYHLRTQDGREVDVLIETPRGYLAFEIKQEEVSGKQDARHLTDLEAVLDKPLLHAFVLSNDPLTRKLGPNITAVSTPLFLG